MIYLRKYIRNLLLEKGELRSQWSPGLHKYSNRDLDADVELKKHFRQKSDQASLQNLIYIHWADIDQIEYLLESTPEGSKNKNEINAFIHSPDEEIIPWNIGEYTEEEEKIGLEFDRLIVGLVQSRPV